MNPVVVFDVGIGSYLLVEKLKRKYPKVDYIYLADRASFPYGLKTKTQLLNCIYSAIKHCEQVKPQLVVIASNVPSVTILDELMPHITQPITGVYPPIEKALSLSKSKNIGVLGVKAMTESKAIQSFIAEHSQTDATVNCFNASELVHLVESGTFVNDKAYTLAQVTAFITKVLTTHPAIDTFTLSSTNLPWLESYFIEAFPALNFVDPADDVIESLPPLTDGQGQLQTLVTSS